MTMVLAAALITVAACSAALAAANRAGMLDFLSQRPGTYLPEDAQSYVETDVASVEENGVTINVRESYYDGRTARLTVDVTPSNKKMLLLGTDASVDDNWQNLVKTLSAQEEWDESDKRVILDFYREGGYEQLYNVSVWTEDEANGLVAGVRDYVLDPQDGTLTYFVQEDYLDNKPERPIGLCVALTPYDDPTAGEASLNYDKREISRTELTLSAAKAQSTGSAHQAGTYMNAAPVDYEDVGVRVDALLIEVMPQEIYYTLDYTVTDKEKFEKLDGGLVFEFIDPTIKTDEYWQQRIQEGPSGGSGTMETKANAGYRQMGTLARNELHEVYTLRAFDCWEKNRYDTHEFTMIQADNVQEN